VRLGDGSAKSRAARWLTDRNRQAAHLIRIKGKIEICRPYPRFMDARKTTMKKNISTLMTAVAALSMSFHSANASLLGMPLHLRAAIEFSAGDAQLAICRFYTDDVLTVPVFVRGC
jgi:hypothetical protein